MVISIFGPNRLFRFCVSVGCIKLLVIDDKPAHNESCQDNVIIFFNISNEALIWCADYKS